MQTYSISRILLRPTRSIIGQLASRSTAVKMKDVLESPSASLSKSFELFPRPKASTPSFELSRRLGNFLCNNLYRVAFEKSYTVDSLLIGANQGASLLSQSFVEGNWGKMSNVAVEELVEELKTVRERLSTSEIEKIAFIPEDVVQSFLHSTVITGKNYFRIAETGTIGIYFTVVSYIRTNPQVPYGISVKKALGSHKSDVLISNVVFARTLNPLSAWKAVKFNVFSPESL